ncbi:hypothetical protein DFR24_3517 [Panacagrimonas perspica]|uniref:Probable membrane transporter protein n=1 Tax=Panacagrimonas perspica TaxID=381431 RepID=A0A4R7P0C3_9GAMM|nr:sulfite exporter TauE/SafE family protein [Panacagrimonas perspica]TDU26491.1 hypothetical protein DFR24_3517 [Panacagrimonas perspica]
MLVLFALGICIGLTLGLTGAGGSIIAVPILMFGMGWTVAQAGPVALLAVASSAAVGAMIGLRQRQVRYRAAILVASCGVVVSPAGLMTAKHIPPHLLTVAFAALLAWASFTALKKSRGSSHVGVSESVGGDGASCLRDAATGRFCWTRSCGQALAITGVGAGFLSGLFGVGGGFFIVPALRRITDLSMNAVIATSMLIIALVSSGAAISAALAGRLPLDVGLPFAFGAVCGMAGGRMVSGKVDGVLLARGFSALCGVIAVLLVAREIYAWR